MSGGAISTASSIGKRTLDCIVAISPVELSHGHIVVSRADLWFQGRLVEADLLVLDGSVSRDASRSVRSHASLRIIDPTRKIIPKLPTNNLAPYGAELDIRRGIARADGSIELVPQGRYRLSRVEVAIGESGFPEMQVTAYDRSRAAARAGFLNEYTISPGVLIVDAVAQVLQDALPNLAVELQVENVSLRNATLPVGITWTNRDGDPWKLATERLAKSIGCDLFFGIDGQPVLRDMPSLASGVVYDTYSDSTNHRILDLVKVLDDDQGYNTFIVTGEPPGAPPIRSVLIDNEDDSPTAERSYGRVKYEYTSQLISTQDQADQVCRNLYQAKRGGTELLRARVIADPGLDVHSVLAIKEESLSIDVRHITESVSLPLSYAEDMTITMRKRRSLSGAVDDGE